jgi:hypothetical protein
VDNTTVVSARAGEGADCSLDLNALADPSRAEEHVETTRAKVAERIRAIIERRFVDDPKVPVVVFPRPIARSPPDIQATQVGFEFTTAQRHPPSEVYVLGGRASKN